MALQYGMNITASDMRSLLEKNDKQQSGIRTWRQLFGNASLGFNAQRDALTTDYTDAIAKAYESNFKQNDAIMGAGLASGMTKEMLSASRNDLHTAYETYVRNYGSDNATVAKIYDDEIDDINTALTERAANFSNLYNSAYKYLSEELFGATRSVPGTAENGAAAKYEGEGKDAEFAGYEPVNRDYINEHGLHWIYELDENGKPTTKLRDWDSLSHDLFNSDGALTKRGVQFFDQMFNTPYENYTHVDGKRNIRSFDEWLSDQEDTFDNYDANFSGMAKNGRELRDWWVSPDTFNYNFAGTNRGTSQVLTGRESTDDVYGYYEYLDVYGLSEFAQRTFDSSKASSVLQAKTQAQKNARDAAEKAKTATGREKDLYEGRVAGYNAAANIQDQQAKEAWNAYLSKVDSAKSALSMFFKDKVGSSLTNEFWGEHKSLEDEYNQLVKDARDKGYYDAALVNKIDRWYSNLLKQMNAYIKKHGYNGKTSGF